MEDKSIRRRGTYYVTCTDPELLDRFALDLTMEGYRITFSNLGFDSTFPVLGVYNMPGDPAFMFVSTACIVHGDHYKLTEDNYLKILEKIITPC